MELQAHLEPSPPNTTGCKPSTTKKSRFAKINIRKSFRKQSFAIISTQSISVQVPWGNFVPNKQMNLSFHNSLSCFWCRFPFNIKTSVSLSNSCWCLCMCAATSLLSGLVLASYLCIAESVSQFLSSIANINVTMYFYILLRKLCLLFSSFLHLTF